MIRRVSCATMACAMKRTASCIVCGMAIMILAGVAYSKSAFDAVEKGDSAGVAEIIRSDPALVHEVNKAGNTPLHIACAKGHAGIARLLIVGGADVNAIGEGAFSPLRYAVRGQHSQVIDLLLEKGAQDTTVHPIFGSLVDHGFVVACRAKTGPRILERLVTEGLTFDPNSIGPRGLSLLDQAVLFGRSDMVRFALEQGANPNSASPRVGSSPLILAVRKRQLDIISLLLSFGAKTSSADPIGDPPLVIAIKNGSVEVVNALLEHGATLDFKSGPDGNSCLHVAAIAGHRDVAEMLVNHGHPVNPVNVKGESPLDLASRYDHTDLMRYLASLLGKDFLGSRSSRDSSIRTEGNRVDYRATVWYLSHRGWVVTTKNRTLVFDAEEFGVRRPDNPSLNNGFLTAEELNSRGVVCLYSCYHGQPGEPAYVHTLADSLKNISYVHLVDDGWRGSPNTTYLKPGADTAIDNIAVRTIDLLEGMPVLGYLLEVDGLTIYYQAFRSDNSAKLKQDYALLSSPTDAIDIAFLPIPEPGSKEESDLHLFLSSFPTRTLCLLDPDRRERLFPEAARMIREWGFPTVVFCAENPGDHYNYGNIKK